MASDSAHSFIVIGENIHTTRVRLRKGKHIAQTTDGRDAIAYTTLAGEGRFLVIPDAVKATQEYDEGRVKHVKIAVQLAMDSDGDDATEALIYLRDLVEKQQAAGAHFLDLNVDEISLKTAEQKAAMGWLARTIQDMATVPICVDSSDIAIIEEGLAACNGAGGRPLLNSASLERPDALDLALQYDAAVIVTAAGDAAMPDGSAERVTNASHIVDAAVAKGIALSDIYVDPLVFPVSVDSSFARHCLDAIAEIRTIYGPEIHITGGFSNVSFGIPARKHINNTFLRAAVAAGADSGIIDPVMNNPNEIFAAPNDGNADKLAADVVNGDDPDCRKYIKAWRRGQL